MGVSANLLVNAKHDVGAIRAVLKGLGYTTEAEYREDHTFIRFVDSDNHHYRMYVARSQEYGGLDATILSFGSRPETIALLRQIAQVLGGMLQTSDTGCVWESFEDRHRGNAQWLVQQAIYEGKLKPDDEVTDKIKEAVGYKYK